MLNKIYRWSSSWTGTIIIVLTIIFFVAQAFVIPSGSMKNTLLIGDMLFVKKFSYGIPTPRIPWLEIKVLPDFNDNGHLIEGDKPQRGDIVVFRYPHNEAIHYVKRLVATGGDLIAMKDKHLLLHPKEGNEYVLKNYDKESILSIMGKMWIVDPYKKEHPGIHNDPSVVKDGLTPYQLFDMLPVEVPEGEYFMMGDNRDHSNDSRFWGTVQYKHIVGKPWFIYFSWDENKEIRWNRIFRSIEGIEDEMFGKEIKIEHKEGIY
ncbi:signal peptidase I [Candidatus Marinarcus aquaticus]|uniref:Signal peptidase I n=1 Tax=Candidatus Marinarcus aquaticus TaxID=2044504 RepID=A0A4Q0XSV6_9BACT|nr:signal peptidase I [Candidatus Marinarcus aquaticus]RXJ60627.1 signal peptidase I [Candidatus Marinarcus aquaticus]